MGAHLQSRAGRCAERTIQPNKANQSNIHWVFLSKADDDEASEEHLWEKQQPVTAREGWNDGAGTRHQRRRRRCLTPRKVEEGAALINALKF